MNLRVGLLSGLLLLSFLGAHAAPVLAQQQACGQVNLTCQTTVQVDITPPSQPIKPLGPFLAIRMDITYAYTATASVSLAATPIELRVTNAPTWVVTTVSPSTVYIPVSETEAAGQQQQQVKTASAFLLVSTTADAPAFQQGVIQITADARANGALLPSTFNTQVPIQADFFSIIEASTPTTIQKAKPQAQVSYPITVTNFGNALTKVEFLIESAPDKWQVTPPSPVTLQARQLGQQQNTRTANVVIQTPFQNGYLNVVGAITIRLKSNYALDPKVIGDATIVSTLTTTKGFYVPGFEPVLAAFALAAAGAFLMRPGDGSVRKPKKPVG